MRSRSLLWSFNYAIEGMVYALRTQRNMRIHVLATFVVMVASLFFRIGRLEFVALVFAIGLVLVTELVNTAVEAAVDVATGTTLDPTAKIAKDVAAGAVFIASINAVIVGYVVFFARLTGAADRLITTVSRAPAHLTVIVLGITAIIVLVAKAASPEGSFLRGGWPSGHVALAVAAASAIGYSLHSPDAAVLGMFIAALVAQARLESETHTLAQVVVGGLLGFLVATAVFQVFWQ